MIRYLFRKPKYPMICDLGDSLIGARSEKRFLAQLEDADLEPGEMYPMVDATGQGWSFHSDHEIISPFSVKYRWTKREVIELFNQSATARKAGLEFPMKSLANKRVDRIIGEIADLIEEARRRIGQKK